MFNKHLFKVIIGFCGMIILGLVSLVVIDHYKNKESSEQAVLYTATEDTSIGSIHAPEGMPKLPPEVKPLSYQDALALYTGRTITFDKDCRANPDHTFVFKNNTKVMINNLSPVSRTIKIEKPISVKGNGFKIINLATSQKLPTKTVLECDTIKGVANITLTK